MATIDHSPRCTLPVDTYVRFTPSPWRSDFRDSYVARVAGTDVFQSKYRLSLRLSATHWTAPEQWAFPGEVEEITEEEANR